MLTDYVLFVIGGNSSFMILTATESVAINTAICLLSLVLNRNLAIVIIEIATVLVIVTVYTNPHFDLVFLSPSTI